jgi:hypothetical protein
VTTIDMWQAKTVMLGNKVFGVDNMTNRTERMMRFLEEACELVQAGGLSKYQAIELVEYVYGRQREPVIHKEFGGTGLTLLAMAEAFGVNLELAIEREHNRVEANAEHCRAKHYQKPDNVRVNPLSMPK